jgi:4-hydroxybenzoate polyprenyltransferase
MSAFSLWSAYNNYIAFLHNREVVHWGTRISARISIALLLVAAWVGIQTPDPVAISGLATSAYVLALACAVTFWRALNDGLKRIKSRESEKFGQEDFENYRVFKISRQWIILNGLLVLYLAAFLVFNSFFGFAKIAVNGTSFTMVLCYEAAIFVLMSSTVVMSSYRAGFFRDTALYQEQADKFNKALEAASTDQRNSHSRQAPKTSPVKEGNTKKGDAKEDKSEMSIALPGLVATLSMIRPFSSLTAAILVGVHTQSYSYGVAAFLFLSLSFLFNDIMDFLTGRDLLAHPERPLPSGAASLSGATIATAGLALVYLSFIAAYEADRFLFFSSLALLSALYSIGLKMKLPVVATPLWSLALTFLVLWPADAKLAHYVAFFCFFYGRELLLDIRDSDADAFFSIPGRIPRLLRDHAEGLAALAFATGAAISFVAQEYWLALAIGALALLQFVMAGHHCSFKDIKINVAQLSRIWMLGIFLV